jgi:Kazal-type serine protease inhibitor-like protein
LRRKFEPVRQSHCRAETAWLRVVSDQFDERIKTLRSIISVLAAASTIARLVSIPQYRQGAFAMTIARAAMLAALAIPAFPLSVAPVPDVFSATRIMTAQLEPKDMSKPRPTVCTEQYEPVCGRINGVPKTYSNQCYARADGAVIVAQGPCADPVVEPGPR